MSFEQINACAARTKLLGLSQATQFVFLHKANALDSLLATRKMVAVCWG